jgi:beta-glucosidase
VSEPGQADVAILRVTAPHETLHPGYFFGSRQHEGALSFDTSGADYARISDVASKVPTIVVVRLDRPAILTDLRGKVRALIVEFGASDRAVLDVLTGKAAPHGKLPFELPSSMAAVEAQLPDTPHDSRAPLYPIHFGRSFEAAPGVSRRQPHPRPVTQNR